MCLFSEIWLKYALKHYFVVTLSIFKFYYWFAKLRMLKGAPVVFHVTSVFLYLIAVDSLCYYYLDNLCLLPADTKYKPALIIHFLYR